MEACRCWCLLRLCTSYVVHNLDSASVSHIGTRDEVFAELATDAAGSELVSSPQVPVFTKFSPASCVFLVSKNDLSLANPFCIVDSLGVEGKINLAGIPW